MKKPSQADSSEITQMMDKATHCLCCGKLLRYLDKQKRRNRGYCSLACYYQKTPKMVYAEKKWGKPIRQIITELLNQTDNVNATAHLLGVEKPQFYSWLKKLNIQRKVMYV